MMAIHRISSVSDPWYKNFYDVYFSSFPVFEQRNEQQQLYAFSCPDYHLDCYLEDDRFLAFIAYWRFEQYIYIEHLAVNSKFRGENIGSKVLSGFISEKEIPVLLEIDPLVDEVSERRFRFYSRLGFAENEYKHFHPSYNLKYTPHPLLVLSYPGVIDTMLYSRFYDDLARIVMKVQVSD